MELKNKYQYTYFLYPYIIEEKEYSKYILKLVKDRKYKIKAFEKERDLEVYDYFLPNIRKLMFCDFKLNKEKISKIKELDEEEQAKKISKYSCVMFEYDITNNLQGKLGDEGGIFFDINKIKIICFNTGICFITIKTHIENAESFEDLLNFNYKFRDINSKIGNLKSFEKIKIQSNNFENMEDITNLIEKVAEPNRLNEELNLNRERFLTYTYTCLDQENWNENKNFEEIKNEFEKFSKILPSNYNVRIDEKENYNYNISKLKFAKIGLTKISTALMTSGMDTYNYTKLPYKFEKEYFYTYILELYKKIYIQKINLECKNKKFNKNIINFIKEIYEQEVTNDVDGNELINKWNKVLEIDKIYNEIKENYNIIYKQLEIDKTKKNNKVILLILIISLVLNIINFIILFNK